MTFRRNSKSRQKPKPKNSHDMSTKKNKKLNKIFLFVNNLHYLCII